jgi:hypothetical protein
MTPNLFNQISHSKITISNPFDVPITITKIVAVMRQYNSTGHAADPIGTLSSTFLRDIFRLDPKETNKKSPILEIKALIRPGIIAELFAKFGSLDMRVESTLDM